MEIIAIRPEEYKDIFLEPYHVFNRVDFNLMNSLEKKIPLVCLGFKSKKYKAGIIGAIIKNKFVSPFSAPFGGLSYAKEEISLETIDETLELLIQYCRITAMDAIELTLPPFFYNESFISKVSNCLYRKGFTVYNNDVNYSIHLKGTTESYFETMHYNAKKNLNVALTKKFSFTQCHSQEEKLLVYAIIKKNRDARGYPLRMSFDAVEKTINIITADFFLVKLDEEPVAGAIVFHIANQIVQVVYWGDLPEYGANRTMNYLSFNVVTHYNNTSVKTIDIGPSSKDSVPNYGLCDFKESIGCKVFLKQSWKYNL